MDWLFVKRTVAPGNFEFNFSAVEEFTRGQIGQFTPELLKGVLIVLAERETSIENSIFGPILKNVCCTIIHE